MDQSESNELKVKMATIIAAVKFWMKYKGKIKETLQINVLRRKFYAKLKPMSSNELEIKINNEVFRVNFEDNVMKIKPIKVMVLEMKETRGIKPKRVEVKLAENEFLIKSQTAGKILRILVDEGESVVKNAKLLVMEAMKMEIEVSSPVTGIVDRIFVKEGDIVKVNEPLMVIRRKH